MRPKRTEAVAGSRLTQSGAGEPGMVLWWDLGCGVSSFWGFGDLGFRVLGLGF